MLAHRTGAVLVAVVLAIARPSALDISLVGPSVDYLPTGDPVTVHLGKISGEDVMAWWFNPRTGVVKAIGTFVNRSTRQFDPPGEPGRGEDWVLVLDDTGYEYKAPAHRAATVPSR